MKRPSNLTALVLLALAVAGSQFLLWWLAPAPKPRVAAGPPRSGYMLENFELNVLGNDGRVDVRLTAPHLQRRDGDGALFIDQPRFELPANRTTSWHGQAEYAWVSADGDEMRLNGAVTLLRPATDTAGAAEIDSRDITLWTADKRLETKAPTAIREPGRILHGVGMQANLAQHTLELLADVHGTFQPSQSP